MSQSSSPASAEHVIRGRPLGAYEAESWWAKLTVGNGIGKSILHALVMHASHQDGSCFPSHATLAREVEYSSGTIRRWLPKLRDLGLVYWEQRTRADGGATANVYWLGLVLTDDEKAALTPRAESATPLARQEARPPRAESATPLARQERDELSIEHPEELSTTNAPSPDGDFEFELRFWKVYPARNGKRLGRGDCERAWAKLTPVDRADVVHAVVNYAAARGDTHELSACDPIRWLRKRQWEEWITPEIKRRSPAELALERQERDRAAMNDWAKPGTYIDPVTGEERGARLDPMGRRV